MNLGYQRPAAQKAIEAAVAKNAAVGQDFDELFRASLQLIR
jgi:Holliday junction DNA helicase RuvA